MWKGYYIMKNENQKSTSYNWVDFSTLSKERQEWHNRFFAMENREQMHRENELRQRKFFKGLYPYVGVSDIIN